MQKKDDPRIDKFRELLENIVSQPKPIDTVYSEYSHIFDKLKGLEKQAEADLRIRHDVKEGVTVWTKVVDSIKAIGNVIDGLIQVKPLVPLTNMAVARGIDEAIGPTCKEFSSTKNIQGGAIQLLISERNGKESVGLRLWVTAEDGRRLDDFFLTIFDEETRKPFFTEKHVSIAYHNEEVGRGIYRITVKSQTVGGSMILDNR